MPNTILRSPLHRASHDGAAVHTQWPIDDSLHWTLDAVLHDDLVRLRTGHGPENRAVIRHCTMDLVRAANGKHSLEVRREKADLEPACLAKLLTRPHPST